MLCGVAFGFTRIPESVLNIFRVPGREEAGSRVGLRCWLAESLLAYRFGPSFFRISFVVEKVHDVVAPRGVGPLTSVFWSGRTVAAAPGNHAGRPGYHGRPVTAIVVNLLLQTNDLQVSHSKTIA